MKRHSLIYHISTVALIISVVVACTEKAEFPLESTYVRLVVDGEINTDTTAHRVILSSSGDALNQHPGNKISGAIVSISDGTNNFSLHENPDLPGVYETDSNVYGVPGNTYTLQISNIDIDGDGNYEEYSASSYLPLINPIDSIKVSYQQLGPQYKGWIINMYAQEIGGGRNFYLVKAWKNNVLLTDSAYECASFADNTGFEGSYYNGFSVYYLNYNKLDERLVDGDVVTLEMDGITQQYKDFLVGFISEYQPKVPIFSGPSANIPTNIEPHDKAVGFFTAYCAMRKSRVYRGE